MSKQSDNNIAGFISTEKFFASLSTDVAMSATINALTSTSSFIRLTGVTTTTINGIADGRNGKIIIIYNASPTHNATLSNESGSATETDRILTATGSSLGLEPKFSAILVYDSEQERWVIIGVNQSSGGGSSVPNKRTITSSDSVTESDDQIFVDCTSGNVVVTLLEANDLDAKPVDIIKIDSSVNTVTVAAQSGDDILGETSQTQYNQYDCVTYFPDGTTSYFVK